MAKDMLGPEWLKVAELLPIPIFFHICDLIHHIVRGVEIVQQNKSSLHRLAERANRVLDTVNAFVKNEVRKKKRQEGGSEDGEEEEEEEEEEELDTSKVDLPEHIMVHLNAMIELLEKVDEFVKKESGKKFMQRFVNRHQTAAKIGIFHDELAGIAQDLQMALEIDLRQWLEEDKEDRKNDLADMDFTLQHLVDNDYKILNALELKQQDYLEALEALQKNLTEQLDETLERNIDRLFMEKALNCLLRASQTPAPPKVEEWILTSWEIEIGDTISRGGFGEVAKAIWLGHTTVAVKRLLIRLDTNRLREDFYREVKTWYPLRHPHILPLLGACATAERPFMVSPFMTNGHALQYLDRYPGDLGKACQLLYEMSQGMQYLHSRNVIHGDFKAVNVLVNEHGKACVADFGFAALKKVTSTRATNSTGGGSVAGTLRWMAPERLMGGPLTPAVDVYAFAMTCYEILTEGDIPLTNIPDALIYQSVVNNNLRPQRPDDIPDSLWSLMKSCWHPDPLQRPSFATISVTLKAVCREVQQMEAKYAIAYGEEVKEIPGSVVTPQQAPNMEPTAAVKEEITPTPPPEPAYEPRHVTSQLFTEEPFEDPPEVVLPTATSRSPPRLQPNRPNMESGDSGFASNRESAQTEPTYGASSSSAGAKGTSMGGAMGAIQGFFSMLENLENLEVLQNLEKNEGAIDEFAKKIEDLEKLKNSDKKLGELKQLEEFAKLMSSLQGGKGMMSERKMARAIKRAEKAQKRREKAKKAEEKAKERRASAAEKEAKAEEAAEQRRSSHNHRHHRHGNRKGSAQTFPSSVNNEVLQDPNFKLQFEKGGWGEWITNMSKVLPAGMQTEVQCKLAVLGDQLNQGNAVVKGSKALEDIAKELKKAVVDAKVSQPTPYTDGNQPDTAVKPTNKSERRLSIDSVSSSSSVSSVSSMSSVEVQEEKTDSDKRTSQDPPPPSFKEIPFKNPSFSEAKSDVALARKEAHQAATRATLAAIKAVCATKAAATDAASNVVSRASFATTQAVSTASQAAKAAAQRASTVFHPPHKKSKEFKAGKEVKEVKAIEEVKKEEPVRSSSEGVLSRPISEGVDVVNGDAGVSMGRSKSVGFLHSVVSWLTGTAAANKDASGEPIPKPKPTSGDPWLKIKFDPKGESKNETRFMSNPLVDIQFNSDEDEFDAAKKNRVIPAEQYFKESTLSLGVESPSLVLQAEHALPPLIPAKPLPSPPSSSTPPPMPIRKDINDATSLSVANPAPTLLDRRIPNASARQFWIHYWSTTTFEVTLSDFLSCLEEHYGSSLPRAQVISIVRPVENLQGERMVGTKGLNALVAGYESLIEALDTIVATYASKESQGSGGPPPLMPVMTGGYVAGPVGGGFVGPGYQQQQQGAAMGPAFQDGFNILDVTSTSVVTPL
ncbi:hypothetical protein HDV05_002254 [Chytridiales sp. JEL 0842]|nr:hypothetical protein HDV05_002254 [Chytridiales sp. JEL 0842]